MKKLTFVLIITVFAFISCKDKKQAPEQDKAQQKTEQAAQNPAKDSAEIRKVIVDFYNWYNKNNGVFQQYNLYSGIKKKETPPYKINWDQVEKYQDFIRSSVPQLGEEFIKNQKYFLRQCDSAFKVDVKDELPYGFDYDWYTDSQEDPQYLLDRLNGSGIWKITANGNEAQAEVTNYYDDGGKQAKETVVSITMKKEKGGWKIAKIGKDFTGE